RQRIIVDEEHVVALLFDGYTIAVCARHHRRQAAGFVCRFLGHLTTTRQRTPLRLAVHRGLQALQPGPAAGDEVVSHQPSRGASGVCTTGRRDFASGVVSTVCSTASASSGLASVRLRYALECSSAYRRTPLSSVQDLIIETP